MEIIDYSQFLTEKDIFKNEKGDEYVYVAALTRIAKHNAEMQGWDTEIVQCPDEDNNYSATVKVRVQFKNGDFASGAADCRYSTAGEGFQNFTTAIAETRALGRALRRYLDINLCTFEEQDTGKNIAITDMQIKTIETQYLNKDFSLKDVSSIIGRDLESLKELSYEEGILVLKGLGKLLKKVMKE